MIGNESQHIKLAVFSHLQNLCLFLASHDMKGCLFLLVDILHCEITYSCD